MTCLHRRPLLFAGSLAFAACSMDNPEFVAARTTTAETGDGDGDGDGDTVGDGDGDTTTGDGDGDGDGDTTTGDGDGDTTTGDGDGDGDGDGALCGPGQLECDGQCVGPDDNANCGECGNACDADVQLCDLGACLPVKHIFVSSEVFNGDVLLLAFAQICNDLAANGSLDGEFRPWLSTPLFEPAATFSMTEGVFKLPNGPIVAWSWTDLVDGQLEHPINFTELGIMADPSPACNNTIERAVWTGTNAAGGFAGPSCGAWLNGTGLAAGRVGNADADDGTWSATDCQPTCNNNFPIYCVQQ